MKKNKNWVELVDKIISDFDKKEFINRQQAIRSINKNYVCRCVRATSHIYICPRGTDFSRDYRVLKFTILRSLTSDEVSLEYIGRVISYCETDCSYISKLKFD
jgi:hypothetical protein